MLEQEKIEILKAIKADYQEWLKQRTESAKTGFIGLAGECFEWDKSKAICTLRKGIAQLLDSDELMDSALMFEISERERFFGTFEIPVLKPLTF